jgi:hypothetical protein
VDEFLELRRQRADIVSQFWNEIMLNHIPALQNQFTVGSIHGVGVMMLALTTCIMPEMAAHALPLQNSAQKITLASRVLQEALLKQLPGS